MQQRHSPQINWDEVPLVLDVNKTREILGLGRNTAYELFNRKDFPAFRVGKSLRITKEALRNWLENHKW